MSFRQLASAIAIVALAPAALAEPGQWIQGEIGFVPAPPQSTLTRDQVRSELTSFIKRGGQLAAGERAYFDPAAPAVVRSAEAVNSGQLGGAARRDSDPYANGGPN
jgi:hypothetical protein